MNFAHSRDGAIKLGAEALATLRSYEQYAPHHLEAGGFLLGRLIRNDHDVVVDRVTTPQPGDQRSRFGFDLDAAGHQPLIDAAWQESGGTCTFLGDWHTHAEPDPKPSGIDLKNWHRRLREDVHDGEACFFVIVGTAEIRVWEGIRATGSILACTRHVSGDGA